MRTKALPALREKTMLLPLWAVCVLWERPGELLNSKGKFNSAYLDRWVRETPASSPIVGFPQKQTERSM